MSKFQAGTPKSMLKEAVEEGNAFTAALAKTPKGGKAKVDGQEITDTSGYDDSSVKENKYDFVKSAIESAAGDKISHTEYDDFDRKIYWSSTNPHVVYYVGSENQIIKYDGKTGERYPIGDLKHYDTSPDDDATMEEKKPHRSATGRGMREGLRMPPLQATGQTIDTVEENSMIDAPFGVVNPGTKKQLEGPGLQLSNLTTEERKQLGEFVDAVKTTKKAIEELLKKASGKDMKVKEDMGGNRTDLVMTPGTVSEAGMDPKSYKFIESQLDTELHDAFETVVDKIIKNLEAEGVEEDLIEMFLKHEIEKKAKEAIMGQHDF